MIGVDHVNIDENTSESMSRDESSDQLKEKDPENGISEDSYLPEGTISLFGAIANLTNSIIGSTVLSLPESNKESGILGTLFMNIFLFIGTAYSLYVIIEGANLFKVLSINKLFYVISGNLGVATNVFVVAFMAGAGCIAYYVIMADSLIGFIQYVGLGKENYDDRSQFACNLMQNSYFIKFLLFIMVFVFLIPTKISELTIVSVISVIFVFFLFLCIIILAIKDLADPEKRKIGLNTVKMFNTVKPFEMLNTISVYSQAYICHFNVLPIRCEMKNRTKKDFLYLTIISPFIGFIVYEFLGMVGYLQYGEAILGNITLNYGQSFLQHAARFSVLIVVYLTFPVLFFAARKIVHNFFYSTQTSMSILTKKGLIIFIPLYVTFSILSLFTASLSKILTLTGSIFGPFITFNLPAVVKIFSDLKIEQLSKSNVDLKNFSQFHSSLNSTTVPKFHFKKKMIPFYLLFLLGSMITVFGIISSIKKFVSDENIFDVVYLPLKCGVSYRYKELMESIKNIKYNCKHSKLNKELYITTKDTELVSYCPSKNPSSSFQNYDCEVVIDQLSKIFHTHYAVTSSFPEICFPASLTDQQKNNLVVAFYKIFNNYFKIVSQSSNLYRSCAFYDQTEIIIKKINISSDQKEVVFADLNQSLSTSQCKDIPDFNNIDIKDYKNELARFIACFKITEQITELIL